MPPSRTFGWDIDKALEAAETNDGIEFCQRQIDGIVNDAGTTFRRRYSEVAFWEHVKSLIDSPRVKISVDEPEPVEAE